MSIVYLSLSSPNTKYGQGDDLIEWVNSKGCGNYIDVEEMCSGVAYCQMLELLFPNCINPSRIIMSARLEKEYVHNLKLLQGALTHLKVDKDVPIQLLVKGRYRDNYEFLKWFKMFFETKRRSKEIEPEQIQEKIRSFPSSPRYLRI